MGMIEEEFAEARVGVGRGWNVLVGSIAGVSVFVGVITTRVEVEEMDVGEAGRTAAVDCGCNTFTWNEQALVTNKASRIQFFLMG